MRGLSAKPVADALRDIARERFPNGVSRKRASYRFGVRWIALNDEPVDGNPDSIASYISTALLADLFGKTTEQVAKDIARYRDRPCNPRVED